ncbi:NACHT, LRR and PYD domains-containing protein 3 isoform X1 [Danio aesculapii]|uniref:NACHT, LRR and PYD domains-containing protein 3 isoform X1 n=1 Tax=Danio aesculapii TaxID=1142201 RepID=UPI0024C0CD33|nr:NACHT, LRR and PYD domains-containing protein 3 isoform X1 [Danio aesculapii]XP_056329910.1 NACHT, LRR and PYD domains-containing protein 3 isoform X1 [Danio aesculapii]XP_056329911.1 NACHT, LRR and PYD domains-containing protein 3 isoform X1 [Danio aesculapii]XP_056329912.1 NACHT, LRR and PYD domains-containing protein 3 isoform X1 [Danio aesculapii]XP_056329913.1 NACHT, LRR and PYD domains-containing protein 3 isoform X1 [Danio aesculapii]
MDGTQPSIDEDIRSVTSSLSSKKSDSPDSSHVSIKSDWSMEPPPLLDNKNKSSDSPESSHVSMKSDWSMEPPPLLDNKDKSSDSPESSHVSMKSDWSMEPPPLLDNKNKSSDSPESSHVSMNSDWSMEPPPLLANKNKSSDSPQSRHVSMNSDWPMEPPSFLADKKKLSDSPESSHVSMKSDWPMEPPSLLADKKKLSDSPQSSHVSIKSDWPMEPPSLLADKKKSPDSPESSHECMKIDCSMEPSPILTDGNKSSAHRSNLLKRCQCLYEGTVMQGDPTLLNEIYTEVYITESESGEISNEHEVRQIETQSRRSTTEDTPIKCRDIFTPLPGQDKAIRTVLTKGVAGIGKTVSVQKFILDWAEEKENQDVQFIFPLPFREINLMDKKFSLLSLLQTFFTREIHLDLIQNSSIIFIFDGLDECRLPFNFSSNETLRDMTKETSVDVLLTNLIMGNLLPFALIWITSRPAAADLIPSECVHRVTEVRGFNDPQKEEYFRKRISDQSLANTIISHLKSSRSLYIMCHIPVFCWISATVLEKMLSEAETAEIPKTLTQMYTHFLILQTNIKHQKDYEEKLTDEDMIFRLGKLAYEQLERGNVIFYEEDLRECGIDVAEASVYSGLCTQIFREEFGLYQAKVFSFVHLSVQEHLAALYVHLSFTNHNINVFEQMTKSFEGFKTLNIPALQLRTFNVGLIELSEPVWTDVGEMFELDCRVVNEISALHCRAVDKVLQNKNGHLDLFLRFLLGLSVECNQILLQRLMKQRRHFYSDNKTVEYIKKQIRTINSPEKSISLFHCLNELGDYSLVEEIQQYLTSGKIKESKLSSSQWSAVAFVLLTSEKKLEEFRLKEFVGAETKADHVLQKLLPVVKESRKAELSKCGLTEECCTALASALRSKLSQVRELDLSGNKLGDSGMKTLSSGLENLHCKLEILRLRSCGITATGCTTLASALWSNPKHIRELDLSENNIRDWGFKDLFNELKNPDCKLEKLGLSNCGISIEGCAALTSALIINPSHLRELDISRNSLGDTGQELLTSLLNSQHHKLEKLLLHKFPMTYTSLPSSHSPEMFPQRFRTHNLKE